MESWSDEREAVEWARNNLHAGDKVFLDCSNCRNFEEILMLSRFVGSSGRVVLLNEDRNGCLSRTVNLHNLRNL